MADTDPPSAHGLGVSAGRDVYAAGRDFTINYVYPQPADRPVRRLPGDVEGFVGRRGQLDALTSWLHPERNPSPKVNVSNGPACGKTALALVVAFRVAKLFPGAQLFLEMSGPGFTLDPGEALRGLLRQLRLTDSVIPATVRERRELLESALPDHSLIVLDNVISVSQVEYVLPRHPSCAVLMTSRSSLGELEPEGLHEMDLGSMSDDEAYDLLASAIGADRAAAEPDAVREIVRLCGALPLALRIAAVQLKKPAARHEPVETFAARLRDERKTLDKLTISNRSVRASFQLSYDALSAPATRLFRLLGWVQLPDFTRALAEAVDGTDNGPEAFSELCGAYLAENTGTGRFRLHDLLALFAQERAGDEDPASRDAALRRAIDWCAERAAALGDQIVSKERRIPGESPDTVAIAGLEAERDVMLAMIRRAAAEGYDTEPLLITSRLARFFEVREAWAEWLEAAELSVMSAERAEDPEVMAGALLQRAWPLRLMRKTPQATADTMAALEHVEGLPAGKLRADILAHLGMVYREGHRYDEAEPPLREAIAIFTSLQDTHGEGLALRTLGHVQARRMDLTEARSTLERAITLLRDAGDRVGEGWTRNNLCRVLGDMWRYDDAAAQFRDAMAIFTELPFRQGQGWALNRMAKISVQYGRIAEAVDYGDRALTIFRELHDEYGAGWALVHLASAREDAGLARQAREAFLRLNRPEDDGQGWALVTLARLTGDPDRANEAFAHFEVVGSLPGQGTALAVRGDIERAAGRSAEAERSYHEALRPLEQPQGDPHRAALVRLGLARLAREAGDDVLAREQEQAAQSALTALGAPEADAAPGHHE